MTNEVRTYAAYIGVYPIAFLLLLILQPEFGMGGFVRLNWEGTLGHEALCGKMYVQLGHGENTDEAIGHDFRTLGTNSQIRTMAHKALYGLASFPRQLHPVLPPQAPVLWLCHIMSPADTQSLDHAVLGICPLQMPTGPS